MLLLAICAAQAPEIRRAETDTGFAFDYDLPMDLPDGVRMKVEVFFSEQAERLEVADAEVAGGRLAGRLTLTPLEPVSGAYRFLIQPDLSQPDTLPGHVVRGLHRFRRDETVRVGSEEDARKDRERIRDDLVDALRRSVGALDAFGKRIEEAGDGPAGLAADAEKLTLEIRDTSLAVSARRAYFLFDFHHMAAHAFEDFGGVAGRLNERVRAPSSEPTVPAIRAALQRRLDVYLGRLGIPVRNDALAREWLTALHERLAAASGDVPDDVKRLLLDLTWVFPNDFETVQELTQAVHRIYEESAEPAAAHAAIEKLRARIP